MKGITNKDYIENAKKYSFELMDKARKKMELRNDHNTLMEKRMKSILEDLNALKTQCINEIYLEEPKESWLFHIYLIEKKSEEALETICDEIKKEYETHSNFLKKHLDKYDEFLREKEKRNKEFIKMLDEKENSPAKEIMILVRDYFNTERDHHIRKLLD